MLNILTQRKIINNKYNKILSRINKITVNKKN